MEKEFDVIALGELLIDFTMNGKSGQGNNLFEANPGGAPCNVLAILQKLGKKTAFIGKVGDDQFGRLLRETIREVGINDDNLLVDKEVNTTLAFVHTFPDGDREFSFYRKPGADMMLEKEEIREEDIAKARIFHFGTLSMTHENVREATLKAVEIAKKNGLLVSLDPNLRPPLWSSLDVAKEQMLRAMEYCDILKISDNEIQFLTGVEDYEEGIRIIRERFQIPLICLTLGKDGSRAYYKDLRVEVPGFVQAHVTDTTGAGDTFCGSVLNYILEHGIEDLEEENLEEMLTFANAAASLVTTRKGAIRSMPEKEEIEKVTGGTGS
ncbi:MAG: carbohydrate kinase [Bariatricus sp.]